MDSCGNCNSLITKEMHVIEGIRYCSKECAVEAMAEGIRVSAQDTAEEWYNDDATVYLIQKCTGIGCDVILNDLETVWSSQGELYCSRQEAWLNFTYSPDCEDIEAAFESTLEEVRTADIGLREENADDENVDNS